MNLALITILLLVILVFWLEKNRNCSCCNWVEQRKGKSQAVEIIPIVDYHSIDDKLSLVTLTWQIFNPGPSPKKLFPTDCNIKLFTLKKDLQIGELDLAKDGKLFLTSSPISDRKNFYLPVNFKSTIVQRYILNRETPYLAHIKFTTSNLPSRTSSYPVLKSLESKPAIHSVFRSVAIRPD